MQSAFELLLRRITATKIFAFRHSNESIYVSKVLIKMIQNPLITPNIASFFFFLLTGVANFFVKIQCWDRVGFFLISDRSLSDCPFRWELKGTAEPAPRGA